MRNERESGMDRKQTDLNFRPLLFCAVGLAFGIFLYGKIAFGGLLPSDFLFLGLLLLFSLRPFSLRRILAVVLTLALSAGVGALGIFLYDKNFRTEPPEGDCMITGTAISVSDKGGYSLVVLSDLSADGEKLGGKCRLYLRSEDVLPADEIVFFAELKPVNCEEFSSDGRASSFFSQNIRYTASCEAFRKVDLSSNPFLRFNRLLFQTLFHHMDRDTAGVGYALLTGNSGSMDEGIATIARRGGFAHLFAVSGLHIGILFSAVYLLFRPLKRYRFFPAAAAALCYCALCNFTASSVRAFLMCAVLGLRKFFGTKYDYLDALSFAALILLLFSPQQWFSWGFKLSFGACAGIGLFSGSFSRFFAKWKFPKAVRGYLSMFLGVQIFLFPLQLEMSGYFPVFGIIFNLLAAPLMPALFLGLLIFTSLAVFIPPAAPFFLALPDGMLALFLFLFASAGSSFVLKGFSLGVGAAVWLCGCLLLSERLRLSVRARAFAAAALVLLFSSSVVFENVVFSGCRVDFFSGDGEFAALVSTKDARILLIDGEISLDRCEDILNRRGGETDAVVVLSDDPLSALNTALFLPQKTIYLGKEVAVWDSCSADVEFAETFSCGGVAFRYVSEEKLLMIAEGIAVEVDFGGKEDLGVDLFLGDARGDLKYFLKDGKIYA